MSAITELYMTRVRSMVPSDRLQLARLILDDLPLVEDNVLLTQVQSNVLQATVRPVIQSPRLAHSEQSEDFVKRIVEPPPDAKV